MIRPLRRRHPFLIAAVFVALAIATFLAFTHPPADPVMDTLPHALQER